MADAVLFVGWNRPHAGKEKAASGFFAESMALWGALQKEGKIESFEPVLLHAHGGDLNGFILVRGEAKKLEELRRDERVGDMILKGTIVASGFGMVGGYVGSALEHVMKRYQTLI